MKLYIDIFIYQDQDFEFIRISHNLWFHSLVTKNRHHPWILTFMTKYILDFWKDFFSGCQYLEFRYANIWFILLIIHIVIRFDYIIITFFFGKQYNYNFWFWKDDKIFWLVYLYWDINLLYTWIIILKLVAGDIYTLPSTTKICWITHQIFWLTSLLFTSFNFRF